MSTTRGHRTQARTPVTTAPRRSRPRPVRPVPALLAGLLAGLLAVLVVGCGRGPSGAAPDPNAPLPRYATLAELGAAAGAQQKADRTAKIVITGGMGGGHAQGAINGEGALRYDDAGPSMQLTQRIQAGAGQPPLELGLVVLPDQAYIRPPANAAAALPPGKTWLRVVPGSSDPVSRQFAQLVQAIRDNADPTRSFAQFGDAVTIVESAEETLDGVKAMRYKLRVDLAKAAEKQTDPTIQQSLRSTVASGLATIDYGLWLDAQNHTLRVLVDQPLPQNQGTFILDARYRDFGQPVQIDPPPADQVVER